MRASTNAMVLVKRAGFVMFAGMMWACGGNGNHGAPDASAPAPAPPDAAQTDAPPPPIDAAPPIDAPPPLLPHHDFVINKANEVPTTQAGHTFRDFGLDLGSPTSSTLDGKVDNQIGQALGALTAFSDIQGTIDTAIATGTTILLVDLQTTDFTTAPAASLTVKFGADPQPGACASPVDTVCGGHLKGNATFAIAADSPTDAPLTGSIDKGTFTSGAGALTITTAIGNADKPIPIHLIHARATASGISATGITTAKLGGIVTQDELVTGIMPGVRDSINGVLANAGCNLNGDPHGVPTCGCTAPNTATGIILGSIDGDDATPKDCKITVNELLTFAPIQAVLKPDVCSQATCAAPDAYSIGIQVSAVKATFPNH